MITIDSGGLMLGWEGSEGCEVEMVLMWRMIPVTDLLRFRGRQMLGRKRLLMGLTASKLLISLTLPRRLMVLRSDQSRLL